MQRSRIICKY